MTTPAFHEGVDPTSALLLDEHDLEPVDADDWSDSVDRSYPAHHVTTVLVVHDGEAWLPAALAAMRAQTRAADAVDTGSVDASHALVAEAMPTVVGHLFTAARDTAFGQAVSEGLRVAKYAAHDAHPAPDDTRTRWIWILHDDCAPEPTALQQLLTAVDGSTSLAVVGPKVRGWVDPRNLLETGITMSRGGRRETGLERGEHDQGQHDQRRDVLAVGSAGMLVRRDVWDQL